MVRSTVFRWFIQHSAVGSNLLLGNSKSCCCKHGEASMCTLLSIHLHVYSEVNWLIIILLNFWGTSTLFSLVFAPFYIPTKNATVFRFLHIFSDTVFSFTSFLPPFLPAFLLCLPSFFFLYYPSSWVGKTHETLTWDLKASMKALRQKKKKSTCVTSHPSILPPLS